MPKRIEGVSLRLQECAREEFLNKGFQNASIRNIAQKAGTSPRAVYTRFPDKEGLFISIVKPAADGFIELFINTSKGYWGNQDIKFGRPIYSSDPAEFYLQLIDYTYDHFDEFTLILKCSEGTCYADFVEQLTEINCAYIEKYNKGNSFADFETFMKLLHMLTRSFYSGLFEPLIHAMSREDAHFYVRKLCRFFMGGVDALLSE